MDLDLRRCNELHLIFLCFIAILDTCCEIFLMGDLGLGLVGLGLSVGLGFRFVFHGNKGLGDFHVVPALCPGQRRLSALVRGAPVYAVPEQ